MWFSIVCVVHWQQLHIHAALQMQYIYLSRRVHQILNTGNADSIQFNDKSCEWEVEE